MWSDSEAWNFYWRPGTSAVLSIDTFQVAASEYLFIKGPSGSGKSTLLSRLSGVTTAVAGSVRVMRQELERLCSVQRDHFRADHIGFIIQMFSLIPDLSAVGCRLSAVGCRLSAVGCRQRHSAISVLRAASRQFIDFGGLSSHEWALLGAAVAASCLVGSTPKLPGLSVDAGR